ncbi:hypothetical protein BDY24DRAFT_433906, partial [Mrakia frigida]|uniref:uncharacterized protein n=1 Tax=Mrakia frigida TaxID=29902 RepID=UPI003FCC2639
MASTRAKFYILFTLILLLELFVFNIASPLLAWSSISPSSSSSNSRPRLPELELALDGFIPPLKPAEGHEWISQSRSTVRRVVRCLAEGLGGESGCREEELKVVIALHSDFKVTVEPEKVYPGEIVFAGGVKRGLWDAGYSLIQVSTMEEAVRMYRTFSNITKSVIMRSSNFNNEVDKCHEDKQGCLQSVDNPDGIPPWKIFGFSYFGKEELPLGSKWMLTALPRPDESYHLGLNLEKTCTRTPLVPWDQRRNRIFILSKLYSNFYFGMRSIEPEWYERLASDTGMEIVSVARDDTNGKHVLPEGIQSLGTLSPNEFRRELSFSRVLLGIGFPLHSPTPYEALCLNVPFVNPFSPSHLPSPFNGSSTDGLATQHAPLSLSSTPAVYNIPRLDYPALLKAVKDTSTTELKGFVKGREDGRAVMREISEDGMRERLKGFMDGDWEGEWRRRG